MSYKKKPREWWIYEDLTRFKDSEGNKTPGLEVYNCRVPHEAPTQDFHVIEKSAYDAVVRERDTLRAVLEHEVDKIEARYAIENNSLKREVEALRDFIHQCNNESFTNFVPEAADAIAKERQ